MRVQYTVTSLLVYVELMDQYQYCLNDIHTAAFIRKLRFLYGLKSPCEGVYILYHAANCLLFLRVVSPGAYKPSDGEGIESRRPLFLSFSLSLSHFIFTPILVCEIKIINNNIYAMVHRVQMLMQGITVAGYLFMRPATMDIQVTLTVLRFLLHTP